MEKEILGSKGQVIAIMRVKVLKQFFTPMGETFLRAAEEARTAPLVEPAAKAPSLSAVLALLKGTPTPPAPVKASAEQLVTAALGGALANGLIEPERMKEVFSPEPQQTRLFGKKDYIIPLTDIRSKWDAGKAVDYRYDAEVNMTQKTIRVFGHWKRGAEIKPFDRNFAIGDEVEYGSYNLIYTGQIVSISAHGIKVNTGGRNQIMKLYEFIGRNWDLDLDAIHRKNANFND